MWGSKICLCSFYLISSEIWQSEPLTQRRQNKVLFKILQEAESGMPASPLGQGRQPRWPVRKQRLSFRFLFEFPCEAPITLHWFAWMPKAPESSGWWSRLSTSGHPGSSFYRRCEKHNSWEALADGQDVCCVYAEGSDTDSRNTSQEHTFFTLWLWSVIFIHPKFLCERNEWVEYCRISPL